MAENIELGNENLDADAGIDETAAGVQDGAGKVADDAGADRKSVV